MPIRAILFDLDGTLVDSNERHVDAWQEAFREVDVLFPRERIHAQVGKGGDLLVPALLPDEQPVVHETIARRHGEIFKGRYLLGVRPFPQAHALVARAKASGRRVAFASSASQAEIEHYLGLLDARALVDATVGMDDVATSKPAPDIFAKGLAKLSVAGAEAIAIGDTPYDIEAAARSGIATIALRSGGFADAALADALVRYDDAAALLAAWNDSPLAA